jgi:hypothetical protein
MEWNGGGEFWRVCKSECRADMELGNRKGGISGRGHKVMVAQAKEDCTRGR